VGITSLAPPAFGQEEFQFRLGSEILLWCSVDGGATACLAYIEGIADALASGASIHGWRACFNESANAARLQVLTVDFLRDHKGDWNKGAASLVAAAIAEGFPCGDAAGPKSDHND
jgi:hypothetical protein